MEILIVLVLLYLGHLVADVLADLLVYLFHVVVKLIVLISELSFLVCQKIIDRVTNILWGR